MLASRQLREAGFGQLRATTLEGRHVDVLIERWKAEKLSPGTLKNRIAHPRWWAEKVGRPGIIPADNRLLAIPERRFVTNEDKSRNLDGKVERVSDPYVRMSLMLQEAFGLRREESIKFQPRYADRGDCIISRAPRYSRRQSRAVKSSTAFE